MLNINKGHVLLFSNVICLEIDILILYMYDHCINLKYDTFKKYVELIYDDDDDNKVY